MLLLIQLPVATLPSEFIHFAPVISSTCAGHESLSRPFAAQLPVAVPSSEFVHFAPVPTSTVFGQAASLWPLHAPAVAVELSEFLHVPSAQMQLAVPGAHLHLAVPGAHLHLAVPGAHLHLAVPGAQWHIALLPLQATAETVVEAAICQPSSGKVSLTLPPIGTGSLVLNLRRAVVVTAGVSVAV